MSLAGPEMGGGVLRLHDGGHVAVERGDERGALGVDTLGEPVEDIDEGHSVPAEGAPAPDLGAEAGGLVGPRRGLRPRPSRGGGGRSPGGRACMLVHEQELVGDVVESSAGCWKVAA